MRLLLVFAVLIGALHSSQAHAQPRHDFSTVRYRPAIGPGNYLGVEGAQTGSHLQLTYGLAFDYSAKTLEVAHPCGGLTNVQRCDERSNNFIQKTGLAHALFGIALRGDTQLSLDLPLGFTDAQPLFYSVNNVGSANPAREVRPGDGFVLGDARLQGKTRLYGSNDSKLRVAAAVFTTLPTAMLTSGQNCRTPGSCTFTGERGVQAGGFGIVDYVPLAKLRVSGNLGVLYRPRRAFLGTEVSSELSFGAAAAYELLPYFTAKAELVGALALLGNHDVPLEARGGVSYGRDLIVTAGGGAGIIGDVGSPAYRVFAGLQYTPVFRDADRDGFADERDKCPQQPEDRDGFQDGDGCPELDNDADGIVDTMDRCKNTPEDRDDFQDDDGCPEADNDGDGVPDGYDSCEGQKEDLDGDRDDDGCPDLDTDRDGVLDAADKCPNEAEDTDGLGDEDGCPELDQDSDGLPDTEDACPEQPETKNGKDDADGCPE
ncbi:MAG: Flagellar motor rotation protein MotB [Myxococcaceae bacterium]|nr:Flagellar motor rotation protein MotB [Myxococcaceae bacterium]